MEEIDLLLINPGNKKSQFGNVSKYATVAQPLGIAMLASFIRSKGFAVKIIDAEVENLGPEQVAELVEDYNPRLIGLTAFTTKMTAVDRIAEEIRKRKANIKLVLGGHHASALPRETLLEGRFDIAIQGEGYYPILEILKKIKLNPFETNFQIKGVWYKKEDEIISNGRADLIELNELPLPAWDLLPMEKYQAHHWQCWNRGNPNSFAVVFSSLGCPFNCEFCSVNVVYGRRFVRYLSPERFVEMIAELVEKYNIMHFEIIDDTFTLNKERVIEICNLLIEKNFDIDMWCFARTDRVDKDMLEKMRKAGINWVFLGIEAGTNAILDNVSKKQDLTQIKNAVDAIHSAGINVGGNFVFGLPGDTMESMQETVNLATHLNCEWSNFFLSMAYPGTDIYEKALGKNLLPEKWEQYGFFAPNSKPLANGILTSREIIEFRDYAFNVFFQNPRYLQLVEKKFGKDVRKYIENMTKIKLKRDFHDEE